MMIQNNTLHSYVELYMLLKDKIVDLSNYIDVLTTNTKIVISKFAIKFGLSYNDAKRVLDILCDLNILNKQESMFICPNCGHIVICVTKWDDGDAIECYACNASHIISVDCTETIYTLKQNKQTSNLEYKYNVYRVQFMNQFIAEDNEPTVMEMIIAASDEREAERVVNEQFYPVSQIKVEKINLNTGTILK